MPVGLNGSQPTWQTKPVCVADAVLAPCGSAVCAALETQTCRRGERCIAVGGGLRGIASGDIGGDGGGANVGSGTSGAGVLVRDCLIAKRVLRAVFHTPG